MLLNFIVTYFNTKTPDFSLFRNLGSLLPRSNAQQEVLGTLSCEISDSKQNVLHLLLLPCYPPLHSAGYHHHPSSDQESEAKIKKYIKIKRVNEDKLHLQRLQQRQNSIRRLDAYPGSLL